MHAPVAFTTQPSIHLLTRKARALTQDAVIQLPPPGTFAHLSLHQCNDERIIFSSATEFS